MFRKTLSLFSSIFPPSISIGSHGFVRLIDTMPFPLAIPSHLTGDYAITQAARVSYGDGTKQINDDKALLRYLWRQKHTTPFEMCVLKFHVKTPIMVERQWLRHRTGSFNEISGRYSVLKDEMYIPEKIVYQSKTNKQGGSEIEVNDELYKEFKEMMDLCGLIYDKYKSLVDKGVSREQARLALPVAIYTEFYWSVNLLNLLKFLKLRMDHHAQLEIRQYANAIYDIINQLFPNTCEAFNDYDLEAIVLSKDEIKALREGSDRVIENVREKREFNEKMEKAGLLKLFGEVKE